MCVTISIFKSTHLRAKKSCYTRTQNWMSLKAHFCVCTKFNYFRKTLGSSDFFLCCTVSGVDYVNTTEHTKKRVFLLLFEGMKKKRETNTDRLYMNAFTTDKNANKNVWLGIFFSWYINARACILMAHQPARIYFYNLNVKVHTSTTCARNLQKRALKWLKLNKK